MGLRGAHEHTQFGRKQFAHQQPRVARLGQRSRCTDQTRRNRLVRRLGSREKSAHQTGSRRGNTHRAQPGETPGLLPASLESQRRRAHRTTDLRLHAEKNRRRTDQQLVRSGRDLRQAARMARRLDARAHDVRRAVRDGPARVAAVESRGRADRQPLRRAEHANHDADGQGRARSTRRVRRFQSRNSLHARFESRAATHLPLPAGQYDHLGRQRLRRQRAAQQEMFRASNRQRTRPRRRLARRASC